MKFNFFSRRREGKKCWSWRTIALCFVVVIFLLAATCKVSSPSSRNVVREVKIKAWCSKEEVCLTLFKTTDEPEKKYFIIDDGMHIPVTESNKGEYINSDSHGGEMHEGCQVTFREQEGGFLALTQTDVAVNGAHNYGCAQYKGEVLTSLTLLSAKK